MRKRDKEFVKRGLCEELMLTRREVNRVSKILNALGNPIRFRILELVSKTDRPLHIKAVAQHLRKDYAAVYRHIKILEKCGLLEVYEVGRSRVLRSKNVEAVNNFALLAKKILETK